MIFGKSLRHRSDEELIIRLQSGEGRALEEIYRRYSPLLLRYFYRMLWQDKAIAQDALHDVFMKIIENPFRVDSKRIFSTWIYSVAHNHCKNEYRKRAFRQSAIAQLPLDTMTPDHADATLDKQAFQVALDKILAEEGEDARTMLVLRFELDMPFAEIGLVLDCPEGTVKSRLFYLKKRLAQVLDPYKTILEK